MWKAFKRVSIFPNSISAVHTSFGFGNSMPVAASSSLSFIVLAVAAPPAQARLESGYQLEPPTGKQFFHQRPLTVLIIPLISAWFKYAFATVYYSPTAGALIREDRALFFFPAGSCWCSDIWKGKARGRWETSSWHALNRTLSTRLEVTDPGLFLWPCHIQVM